MQQPSNAPVIECRKVGFAYGTEPVLADVTFSLMAGDFACFVGPNGGGKTTLVKLLLGLLRPTEGRITVLGQQPAEAACQIGYIPQNPRLDPLFPIGALDIALMGRLGGGHPLGPWKRRDREVALAMLDEVQLADLADRRFGDLSGGQQRRVLIARALACRPKLLLLDEPTANLDRHVEESFYELLASLNRELTIVIVSHDLAFVSRYVRTVVCVKTTVRGHPTTEVDATLIDELYGHGIRLVRHDHDWAAGHCCGDECNAGTPSLPEEGDRS